MGWGECTFEVLLGFWGNLVLTCTHSRPLPLSLTHTQMKDEYAMKVAELEQQLTQAIVEKTELEEIATNYQVSCIPILLCLFHVLHVPTT